VPISNLQVHNQLLNLNKHKIVRQRKLPKKSTKSANTSDTESDDSAKESTSSNSESSQNTNNNQSKTDQNSNDASNDSSTTDSKNSDQSTQNQQNQDQQSVSITTADQAVEYLANQLSSTYDKSTTQYVANGKVTWNNVNGYQINIYSKNSDSPVGSYLVPTNGQFFQIW
jgi:hypothetical protein